MTSDNPFLVATDWLEAHLNDPGVKIVDASWYLPDQNRNGKAEFVEGHIPGAVFFDIDAIADTSSGLPHMLPTEDGFAKAAGLLGISDGDAIVVYDGAGLFSAPRVWWTFRVFGASKVFILDGGLPAWKAEGKALEQGVPHPAKGRFTAKLAEDRVKSKDEMLSIVEKGEAAIADARPQPRFEGIAPEPRPGLRGGHMPGARSVPATLLVRDGRLLPRPEIEAVFRDRGLDLTGDVVTTCGSGVTAAVLSLALDSIGHGEHALYDGSWSQWGLPGDTPVVLGAPEAIKPGSKPRYLKAHITELELGSRPVRREPLPQGHKVALMKTKGMTASFYRYLYREVGKPHHWFLRRNLTDAQLCAAIRYGSAEIWVLYVDGCPAGFFEISLADMPKYAEIQYFGLIPQYQGRGLSKFMLSEAIQAAWDKEPHRVSVQTNTLDNPRALAIYQKAGFVAVGTFDEMIEAWD